jgi:hypothetical protein
VEDLEESFSRSEAAANVNKVSSAATIRHLPSGLAVTASDTRSQSANRRLALTRLLDLFEKQKKESLRARLAAASKARRQRPAAPATKAKLVEGKRRRGETKLRGKIHLENLLTDLGALIRQGVERPKLRGKLTFTASRSRVVKDMSWICSLAIFQEFRNFAAERCARSLTSAKTS